MITFSVDVEVSMNRGKPQMEIVGLPDTSVRESRERIRSALSSLSIALPARLITVNLAPADVKKIGTMHDLAILLGILVCMERIPAQPACQRCAAYGTACRPEWRDGIVCAGGERL